MTEQHTEPNCKKCGEPAVLPVGAPDMCADCNRAAWAAVDAAAAKHGPSTPANNVWD